MASRRDAKPSDPLLLLRRPRSEPKLGGTGRAVPRVGRAMTTTAGGARRRRRVPKKPRVTVAMTPTIAAHAKEVRRNRTIREMANQSLQELRDFEQSPAEMQKLRELVKEYYIPGSSAIRPDMPLSCDGWLQVCDECKGMNNARSTLSTRVGTWRKVRAFLRFHVEQSGYEWCCATLGAIPQFAQAVAAWLYKTTTHKTSVDTGIQVMRMAFKMNRIPVVDDPATRDIRSRTRRERGTMKRKKADITAEHVRLCLHAWAPRGNPMWKRQLALEIGTGFVGLARWSDGRYTSIPGIYWCPEGLVGTYARRKNRQYFPDR